MCLISAEVYKTGEIWTSIKDAGSDMGVKNI